MNKTELIDAVAADTDMSKSDVGAAIDGMFEVVAKQVGKGDKITIPGWISFERTNTSARTGRNPSTGAELKIPAGTRTKITAGSKMKAAGKK